MSESAHVQEVDQTVVELAVDPAPEVPADMDIPSTSVSEVPDTVASPPEQTRVQTPTTSVPMEERPSSPGLEEPLTPATDSSDISKSQPGSGRVTPASQSDQSVSLSSSEKSTPHRKRRGSDLPTRNIEFDTPSTSPGAQRIARLPSRLGIKWRKGERLEAMDYMHKWFPAKIRDINEMEQQVLIHFDGWNQRFDEWVDMDSDRIRPLMRHSGRKEKNRKPKSDHKVGEQVYAKWTDCKMYPAKVTAVLPNGSCEVIFYDGFKKQVQPINMRSMPSELQKKTFEIKPVTEQVLKKSKFRKEATGVSSTSTQSLETTVQGSRSEIEPSSSDHPSTLTASESAATSAEKPKPIKRKSGSSEKKKTHGRVPKTKMIVAGLFKGPTRPDQSEVPEGTQKEPDPLAEIIIKVEPVSTQTEYSDSKTTDAIQTTAPVEPVTSPHVPLTSLPSVTPEGPASASALVSAAGTSSTDLTPSLLNQAPAPAQAPSGYGVPYLPPKAFVVEADHNHFKCQQEGCNKSFRKEHLLDSHQRHYHIAGNTAVTHTQVMVRKRRKTYSTCSNDSEPAMGTSKKKKIRHMSVCEGSPMIDTQFIKQEATSPTLPKQETGEISTQTTPIKQEEEMTVEEMLRHGMMFQDHNEESSVTDPEEYLKPDELVNCICDFYEENGLMIQCEVCLCWQHASCFGITDRTLPKTYVCFVCENPPGVRESSRHVHEQDWFRHGELPCFTYLAAALPSEDRCRAIQATHNLISDLQQLRAVLHSLKLQLKILRTKDEPKLKLWRMDWDVVETFPESVETGSLNEEVVTADTQSEIGIKHEPDDKDCIKTEIGVTNNGRDTDTTQNGLLIDVVKIEPKEEPLSPDEDVVKEIAPGLDTVAAEGSGVAMETDDGEVDKGPVHNGADDCRESNQVASVDDKQSESTQSNNKDLSSDLQGTSDGSAPGNQSNNSGNQPSVTTNTTDVPASQTDVTGNQTNNQGNQENIAGNHSDEQVNNTNVPLNQSVTQNHKNVSDNQTAPENQTNVSGNQSNVPGTQSDTAEKQSSVLANHSDDPGNQLDGHGNQSDMEQEEGNHSDSTESVVEDPIEMCEKNLLSHILRVQTEISDRMDKIEEQMQVLEGLETASTGREWTTLPSKLTDMPQIKRSIRNMTADLVKVKKMAVFH